MIISHDREFLDQLCTKIVETEHGKATTYKGNYTQYVATKAEKVALQWAAYEKQQKEIARQVRNVCTPGTAVYMQLCFWLPHALHMNDCLFLKRPFSGIPC